MAATEVTVQVHLVVDLDGHPLDIVPEDPGTATLHRHGEGLTVHLHLDGAALARTLLPHLVDIARETRKGR